MVLIRRRILWRTSDLLHADAYRRAALFPSGWPTFQEFLIIPEQLHVEKLRLQNRFFHASLV